MKQRPADTCKDMFADTDVEDMDSTIPDLVIDFGSEDEESAAKKKDEPSVPDASKAIKVLTPGATKITSKVRPSTAGPSAKDSAEAGPSAKDLAEAGPSSARQVRKTFANCKNNICKTIHY